MTKAERTALIALPIVILLGAGVAWAGSQGSAAVGGLPLLAICVAAAFLVQWLVFIPAYLRQTEKFFDLTGSLTYISVALLAVLLSPVRDGQFPPPPGPGAHLGHPVGHLSVPPHSE